MTTDKKELLNLIIEAPHIFGRHLGYKDLQPIHGKAIRYIWDTNESRTFQAHRGWMKTSAVVAVGAARNCILSPSESVIIARKEFNKNIKLLFRSIAKDLNSDFVKNIFKILYNHDLVLTTQTDSEIETSLKGGTSREPNLLGITPGLKITGLHADRVITDDIVTKEDRKSRAERENTKLFYQELHNVVNPGGPISNTGTPWHKNDCFSIMPEPWKIPISETTIERFDADHIAKLRKRMTASLYSANYELKHIADENAIFRDIEYFDGKFLPGKRYAHLDARYSGKDLTALTIGQERGENIFLFGMAWDKHVDDCMPDIISLIKKHDVSVLYLENNADKGYLARDIRKHFPAVKQYHESMNKHAKIIQFLKWRWPDIKISQLSNDLYIELIADYNEDAEHDDAPDSAASLIRERFTKNMARITSW